MQILHLSTQHRALDGVVEVQQRSDLAPFTWLFLLPSKEEGIQGGCAIIPQHISQTSRIGAVSFSSNARKVNFALAKPFYVQRCKCKS